VVRIGDQREGQVVLADEFGLRPSLIRGDADDLGIVLQELLRCVAKLARLFGSAGGIGLGEKVDHHALAP
jgi:hypothetical protein